MPSQPVRHLSCQLDETFSHVAVIRRVVQISTEIGRKSLPQLLLFDQIA
jgi:hypothetical protein